MLLLKMNGTEGSFKQKEVNAMTLNITSKTNGNHPLQFVNMWGKTCKIREMAHSTD